MKKLIFIVFIASIFLMGIEGCEKESKPKAPPITESVTKE